MHYLLIALCVFVLFAVGMGCRKHRQPGSGEQPGTGTVIIAPTREGNIDKPIFSGKHLSREDIQNQLARIAKSPPPKELAIGAMCYEIAGPPLRIDYVCPACGQKTLYVADETGDEQARQQYWKTSWKLGELESCRRMAQTVSKLEISLDESPFCSHCSESKDNPTLNLIVQYPDQPEPHKVHDIDWTDLVMIKAFSEGKLKYKDQQDGEVALKDRLTRLEELLGIKLDDTELK